MGDGNVAEVEAIGVFRLPLKNDIVLEFHQTYVVPSLRWNLISISTFDTESILAFLEIDNVVSIVILN